MRSLHTAAAAALALGQIASAAPSAKIFADTNRDGEIDIEGTSDSAGKCSVGTDEALSLPAVTDTDDRCKRLLEATPETDWSHCHDGSDNVPRHPERLALIRTPLGDVPDTTRGSITVTCDASFPDCVDKVRLFRRSGKNEWKHLEKDRVFKSIALGNGLVMGVTFVVQQSGTAG
jgi:protein-arginine deiminase